MRTIWVYKGTPNPPVEPSVVLNKFSLYNAWRARVRCEGKRPGRL